MRKRIWREIKGETGKYIVIFVFMVALIGVASGFFVADVSLKDAYDNSFEKYNIEDGNFKVAQVPDDDVIKAIEEENKLLAGLCCSHHVIATGGSAVYSEQGMENLKKLGRVVFIDIDMTELPKRLHTDLLTRGVVIRSGSTLQDLYDERRPLYQKYADITVNVTGTSIREAALMVSGQLCEKYPESFTLE